jgi:hypothetical protein
VVHRDVPTFLQPGPPTPSGTIKMPSLLLLLGATVANTAADSTGLTVDVLADGNFSVLLDGQTWFDSGDVFVRNGGSQRSVRAGSLRVASAAPISGSDVLGPFTGTVTTFEAPSQPGVALLYTSIRQYGGPSQQSRPDDSSVVFQATLPRGLDGSQQPGATRAAPGLATSFPSFRPPSAEQASAVGRRGWVSYDGWDCHAELGETGFGCLNLGPEPCVAGGGGGGGGVTARNLTMSTATLPTRFATWRARIHSPTG